VRSFLTRGAKIVTLSYSSTVLAALGRRDFRVTVLESLPGGEGRQTARLLRKRGVEARVVADSLAARAVADARFVVVGADAVTPRLIVNKIGTLPLALVARHCGVPMIVVADRSKWVPKTWSAPRGSRAPLFETIPRSLVARVVSERP
jgi:translation initiation factor 2B subunit (eIF-2B alpha/beta/delta family)